MLPSSRKLEQARRSRDARFDGSFFIGVRTTGIYCRPICPVKMPKAENVTFFDSPAAAAEAGFRPCLRCRPESSPGTPAWRGSSTTVVRALRLINDGALDEDSLVGLAERLGVTTRHLSRLFAKHLGATPKTVAQTRRLQFAKKLINETRLPMTEIALSSGYGSVRRFNDHFRQVYDRSPTQLRAGKGQRSIESVELSIPYRKPYDFSSLLDFYSIRAIPGVETVSFSAGATDQRKYVRQFQIGASVGRVTVSEANENLLCCRVEGADANALMSVVQRVRRMFDVDAMPLQINAVLAGDDELRPLINQNPGLRLPGAFDEFEIAVRAIVGQQVSVKGATTVMGDIAKKYGTLTSMGLVFPSPARLADIDPLSLPMPQKRAFAIKELSRQIATDALRFDQDEAEFLESLLRIPGIGPWTAQYILMRAQGDPDAFLHGDLVLKKAAMNLFGSTDERSLIARAEAWRPWRGYAGIHLWRYAGDQKL